MKKSLLVAFLSICVLLSFPAAALAAASADAGGSTGWFFHIGGLDVVIIAAGSALLLGIGFLLRKKSR